MPDVRTDEIALSDERRIRALVKRLKLQHLDPKVLKLVAPTANDDAPPEIKAKPSRPLQLWQRYLIDRRTAFVWHNKQDVWLTAQEDAGVLRSVVISGLNARKDAEVLRSEAWRTLATLQRALTTDEIKELAEVVASSRAERDYRESFEKCVKDVRLYFRWQGNEAVEAAGDWFPISQMRLSREDVELLRRVFVALPRTRFEPTGAEPTSVQVKDEPCPLCGGAAKAEPRTKDTPLKDRKAARKSVADAAFMAWVNARLTDEDKAGVWSLTRALYDDYESWTILKRDDQTEADYAEVKAAVMTHTAWGRLMGAMYAKRKDGKKGYWYNVRLKKR